MPLQLTPTPPKMFTMDSTSGGVVKCLRLSLTETWPCSTLKLDMRHRFSQSTQETMYSEKQRPSLDASGLVGEHSFAEIRLDKPFNDHPIAQSHF